MSNTKITSAVIKDANILTAAIADAAVTSAKIADDVALAGNPTAGTQTAGNNSTRLATTAYTDAAVTALVDSSPSTLNTLNELAAALGDDPNFATTTATSIGLKAPLASPTFTGTVNVTGAVNSTGEMRITNPSATSQLYLYGASGQKANIILNEYGVRSWHVGAGTFTSGNFSISDGSTERMKIDASGRVTMPYQPSFLAFLTTGDVTSGAVLYNNINHNNGSHYTASNGRFTAPVAGYYYFSVSGICGILTGTEVNGEYRMFKNSTLIDRGHFNHDNRWENVSYSKVIPLAVGDYVNMAFLGNTGSPALYGTSVYTSFSGHLLA